MNAEAILAHKYWNPDTFREALKDLYLVEQTSTNPEVEESINVTLKMLAAHLTQLRLLGKVSVLRGFGMMLGDLLMRHPKLPRLRHLTFAQRVGIRMELMIEDVMQAEALPSVDKAKAALTGERFSARRKIVEKLSEVEWASTQELAEASGTTRQNVHQVLLPALSALGLVITREEKGVFLHRCTDLAKRALRVLTEAEPKSIWTVTQPPKHVDVGIPNDLELHRNAAVWMQRQSSAVAVPAGR